MFDLMSMRFTAQAEAAALISHAVSFVFLDMAGAAALAFAGCALCIEYRQITCCCTSCRIQNAKVSSALPACRDVVVPLALKSLRSLRSSLCKVRWLQSMFTHKVASGTWFCKFLRAGFATVFRV